MYPESEAIAIAKRENNAKRAYLVVNKLQGKHIPVSPLRAFGMFDLLAVKVGAAYTDERLLLVGFAETATAIGARLAVKLDSHYIQTTRETYGDVSWLLFSETHSHAVEQKLIRDDIDAIIGRTDRIVFVEDEVTTGNTILNIIKILEEAYPGRVRFAVASLLNGMPQEAEAFYHAKGIGLLYLQKTDHSGYTAIAESYCADGAYFPADTAGCDPAESYCIEGCMDARRCVPGAAYGRACEAMWERICLKNHNGRPHTPLHGSAAPESALQTHSGAGENILVIGTEEFMYPALFAGACLERCGHTVKCHATTRSPIAVSRRPDYPLHSRYELDSLYEKGRRTFIYNLKKYDQVWILTDAPKPCKEGVYSLVNALKSCGNDTIRFFVWQGAFAAGCAHGQKQGGFYEEFL